MNNNTQNDVNNSYQAGIAMAPLAIGSVVLIPFGAVILAFIMPLLACLQVIYSNISDPQCSWVGLAHWFTVLCLLGLAPFIYSFVFFIKQHALWTRRFMYRVIGLSLFCFAAFTISMSTYVVFKSEPRDFARSLEKASNAPYITNQPAFNEGIENTKAWLHKVVS